MADNSAQNGTDTIATDDLTTLNGGAVSGFKVQRVKIGFGVDGVLRDAEAANPLPVTIGQWASTADGTTDGTTLAAVANVIFDGSNYRVARAAYGDAQTPIVFQGAVGYLFDGTNVSRARSGSGVVGAGVQRVCLATDVALPAGTNTLGTTTGPTLTKGTQGSAGYSVQDLKDAGRVLFSAATVIGGVASVSTEALLSLVPTRAGVAAGGGTTQAVTSGKTLRVTAIVAGVRSTGATVLSGRVALRMNPSGAVTATSPIIAILTMTQQAAALAEAGDTCVLALPDGLEFSGTHQIGLTQVCSGTAGVVYASIVGFEY